MTEEVIIVQPVVPNIVVTAPGPQGAQGTPGLVPIFTRQNEISPVVGLSRFYFDNPGTITQIRASVGIAPVGSGISVATYINGTSIGTVTIPAGAYTAVLQVSESVDNGDYATVSILSVGSQVAGSDLTLVLSIN